MAQIARERSEAVAVANPGPLGLSAFALTTFVLSCTNAGLIPTLPGFAIVVGLALFYGGIAQILAGMWEFRTGNTFGATAFTSYGAFWLAVGWSIQNKLILLPTAFGYFLLGWTIFTGIMFLGTLRINMALMAVFAVLFLTFLSLAIGELGGGSIFGTIGGWLGILTALIAWYTALAGLLGRTGIFSLPVGART
jgi:succinate-acetate transporter protein